jgi:hypothetical protein
MTIIRAERPHINYTIIKNETLRNNSLSFRARGIHAYLLSMPDNWRTSALQMSRQGQEGRDAILKALQELEDAGFVKRTKSQDPRGRWHSEIIVYDECCLTRVEMLWKRRGEEKTPKPEKPTSDNQASYKELITNDVEKKSETLLKTRTLICGQCGGSGRVLGFMDSPMECPDCHGDGIQQ